MNKICNRCGKEVDSRYSFCPNCGTIINLAPNFFTSDACKVCGKSPQNGGDGICNCTLGGPYWR